MKFEPALVPDVEAGRVAERYRQYVEGQLSRLEEDGK